MCDGSDKSQELLEKLSRQLSELSSSSGHIDEVLAPDIGSHWAQPSGLPSEELPTSFSRLYTWDPAFLQASSTGASLPIPDPLFHAQDSPLTSSVSIPPVSHNLPQSIGSWGPDILSSHQEYQAVGDVSGRFSNVPNSPTAAHQDYPLIGNSNQFHRSKPHFPSNTPIVGRSFVPPQPTEELFASLPSVIGSTSASLNSHHHSFDIHNLPLNSHHIPGEAIDNFHNTNNSSDLPSPSPFFESHPSFDPSTPPPPFPFQRQLSDTTNQATSESCTTGNDFLNFLQLQSDPSISLDLGTDIGGSDSWQTFSRENEDNISNSEEGKQLYVDALSKWNSFDFAGIDTSDAPEDLTSVVETSKKESVPESAGQDSTKPSYSDIAKTPKVTPVTSKVEQSGSDTSKSQIQSKDSKPYRTLVQRTVSASKIWPKGNLDSDIDQPKVSPTSRYGLDSFEDIPGGLTKNSEGLGFAIKSKRSGSSAAALDNLSVEMAGQNISGEGRDNYAQQAKDKTDQKTKSATDTQSKINTSSSVKVPSATSASKQEEKLFFDPKRIFQPKNSNKSRAQSPGKKTTKSCVSDKAQPEETVLNNGKPTSSSASFKLPTAAGQHDYINNDLRDTNKVTNKTAAEGANSSAHGKNEEPPSKHRESSRSASGKRGSSSRVNGSYHREKRKMADDPNYEYPDAQNGHRLLPANVDWEKLEEWFCVALEKLVLLGCFLFVIARSLVLYTLLLITYLATGAYRLAHFLVVKGWTMVSSKIDAWRGKTDKESNSWKSRESVRRRVGLEENITLPSTGDEAMKRLLACKGKDPYSILGVRQDSSDEDIKKYYRKQAVLVHPDKNQEPGAEEAFKILGHAIEKIGEPSKRKEYDSQALFESESELLKEFTDLISQLQSKIQEAANLMPCDNCGKKHRRYPVERPCYSARFCHKCNIRHSAKEGDVWAETSMLGFYWNYYAVMEGRVYDITEWMKCHHEFYERMRPNEHAVLTRITKDGNKKTKHHHSKEPNLEDLIHRFFHKPPGSGAAGQATGAHSGAEPGWGQASHTPSGPSAAGSAAAKKAGSRRKKKRH